MRSRLALFALVAVTTHLPAQDPGIKPAPNKVTAVTVYQNTALVTREVTTPEGVGLTELVVSPMPPSTMQSSLYAEGTEGVRVLSTRFRTRAIAEDNREEVRKLDAKIKEAQKKLQTIQADQKAIEQNTLFLAKLENFTAATMMQLTEKGQLDSEKIIALTTFIRETRVKGVKEDVTLKQSTTALQDEIAFDQRVLQEKSGGTSRTERDAVIVLDKTKAGASTVRLNYLVSNAQWHPQYKLRASLKDKDPVLVEYLACVTQQTGEDWSGVAMTLSTAQPLLNAAPPDLRTLEVSIGGAGLVAAQGGAQAPGSGIPGGYSNRLKDLDEQSKNLRAQSQDKLNKKEAEAGGKDVNDAAALEQFRDLLVTREDLGKADALQDNMIGGPSVTFRLKDKLTLPSRSDDQILEIAKLEIVPKFYYKAVPVLTPHVYRIADLTNTTELVLLPGEATMYLGTDFVGQSKLPLVAVGKPFTVGFGADPQLQVTRKLVDKTRTVTGGNQVLNFKYRILLNSYKANTVDVQVWDRMPHAEAQQTIAVSFTKGETDLSKDPLYVRDEKPKNLLRWDVKLDPKANGEKAMAIDYEFKLELALSVNIGGFLAK